MNWLLNRGDEVSIELGRLVIRAASGKTVPKDWLGKHSAILLREILTMTGSQVYEYQSYSTGHYGPKKSQGVTLQFRTVMGSQFAYTIFNARLTRSRTTAHGKKGDPLKNGQFNIGKRHDLYRFWLSTELPFPTRLAALYDYMGKLRDILFIASTHHINPARLIATTLVPLTITSDVIREAFSPNKDRTTCKQWTDSNRTIIPDKDLCSSQQIRSIAANLATGRYSHGKAVISKGDSTEAASPIGLYKRPENQSVEEWLADYELTDALIKSPSTGSRQWN